MRDVKPIVGVAGCLALALLVAVAGHRFRARENARAEAEASAAAAAYSRDRQAEVMQPPPPPPSATDFGDGALLRQPRDMQGMTFGFSYPSMHAHAWPGDIAFTDRLHVPGEAPQVDRFPVFLNSLDYQPWDRDDDVPPQSFPRRPFVAWRDGAPDSVREPSPYPGLDRVVNRRLDPDLRAHGVAPEDSAVYIGTRDLPYELTADCDRMVCRAEVYSERSRFAFRLHLPAGGVAHLVDVVRAADAMIVSWAPPGSAVVAHWNDPASLHPAPVEDAASLPDCTAPGYVRHAPVLKIGAASFIATSPAGDIYVTGFEGSDWAHERLYKIAAAGISANAPRADIVDPDIGAAPAGMAVDTQGRIYLARTPRTITRADPQDGIAGHFVDFATGLTADAVDLALDAQGDAFFADFQKGDVMKRTTSTRREAFVARGFARIAGLAVDRSGAVYVTDEAHRRVERLGPDGNMRVLSSTLRRPGALAVDDQGHLFVADNGLAPVVRISASGDACAVSRELPHFAYAGIAVDRQGRVFSTDMVGGVVDEFVPR